MSASKLKNKNELDATYYFIVLLIGSSGAHDYNVDYHIGRFHSVKMEAIVLV